jgi:hypothetical protein
MKLDIQCPYCLRFDYEENVKTYVMNNELEIEVQCERGHNYTYLIAQYKHEILFDYGIKALCDDYYRESVASFTSALERYYEYFLFVYWLSIGISIEELNKSWKLMSNQSERQLGAFISTLLAISGKSPTILKEKDVAFRNKVIHKGYIPNFEETVDYGQEVSNRILEYENILYNKASNGIYKYELEYAKRAKPFNDKFGDLKTVSIVLATYLNHCTSMYFQQKHDLRNHVEILEKQKSST